MKGFQLREETYLKMRRCPTLLSGVTPRRSVLWCGEESGSRQKLRLEGMCLRVGENSPGTGTEEMSMACRKLNEFHSLQFPGCGWYSLTLKGSWFQISLKIYVIT